MFSYRHAFHAGSHADVLKHAMLIAIVRHLTQKDAPLMVVDTHAGAGLYRLDSDFSGTSGEAAEGVVKLFAALAPAGKAKPLIAEPAPMLQEYLETIAGFNPDGQLKIYPGSPFIVQSLLREAARDKLKLFEMHPTDSKALAANIAQLKAGRQVAVARADGFEGMKAFLPPPSRRGLVLIDPSYEIKSDYAKVTASIQDALKRFVTGTYVVWYPVIPRPEAHDLPRQAVAACHAGDRPGRGPQRPRRAGSGTRPHGKRHVRHQPAAHAAGGAAGGAAAVAAGAGTGEGAGAEPRSRGLRISQTIRTGRCGFRSSHCRADAPPSRLPI